MTAVISVEVSVFTVDEHPPIGSWNSRRPEATAPTSFYGRTPAKGGAVLVIEVPPPGGLVHGLTDETVRTVVTVGTVGMDGLPAQICWSPAPERTALPSDHRFHLGKSPDTGGSHSRSA
jgi:hypothetical protein